MKRAARPSAARRGGCPHRAARGRSAHGLRPSRIPGVDDGEDLWIPVRHSPAGEVRRIPRQDAARRTSAAMTVVAAVAVRPRRREVLPGSAFLVQGDEMRSRSARAVQPIDHRPPPPAGRWSGVPTRPAALATAATSSRRGVVGRRSARLSRWAADAGPAPVAHVRRRGTPSPGAGLGVSRPHARALSSSWTWPPVGDRAQGDRWPALAHVRPCRPQR